jgi:hypothetical protein
MIKLFRADQLFPSSYVVAVKSLHKTVSKGRELTGSILQQLIDAGYIPEEKKEEMLSLFDRKMNEYLQFKKIEKKLK